MPSLLVGPRELPADPTAALGEEEAERPPGPSAGDFLQSLVGGVVCGLLVALLWSYFVTASGADLRFFNFALGFLVGVGVLVGANGERSKPMVILAAALGLGTYLLALYFQLSLQLSPPQFDGSKSYHFFTLPLAEFPGLLWDELTKNFYLLLYLFLVPFFAAGTIHQWSRPRPARGGL
jgi:hypothetical protein